MEKPEDAHRGYEQSQDKDKIANVSVHKVETDNPFTLMIWPSNNATVNPSTNTSDGALPLSLDYSSILIKCGPIYCIKSVTYKITRIPLHFCSKEVMSLASVIGAQTSKYFDPVHTTHLICDVSKKEKTASVLCAFLKEKTTIVSKDFIQALAHRKNIQDPLPSAQDFAVFTEESDMPWEVSETLSEQRKTSMKGFKVLSLVENELEPLVICTGAMLVRLYQSPHYETWSDDDWWDQLRQEQEKDLCTIIWLDCKKIKKANAFLKEKMIQLQEERKLNSSKFQIFCVDPRAVAQRIKTLGNLKDLDEKDVFPDTIVHESQDMDQGDASDIPAEEEETAARTSQEHEMVDDSKNQSTQDPTTTTTTRKRDSSHLSSSRVTKPKSTGWISSQRQVKGAAVEDASQTQMSQKKQKIDEKTQGEMTQASLNAPDEEVKPAFTKKDKEKGWLRAAPRGEKRLLYKAACEDQEGGTVQEAAITEVRSDLIVRTVDEPKVVQGSQPTKTVVDYEKFKKNPVIYGSKMHLSKVRLVSVAPKESERFTQLEKLQKEQEKRQQEADVLFEGTDSTMRGTQKQRGGGIRSYFN
jgi:hypothetical protein